MTSIARCSNNDIFLFAGQLAMAGGRIAQAQIIEAAILTVKGELQFDEERGIPYFDTIFESPNKVQLWKANVVSRIREFEWVLDITHFAYDIDYKNHVIMYSIRIATDLGIVSINSIDYSLSTIGTHGGSEGGGNMETLVQNGIFYLPVCLENGVQIYRQLRQFESEEIGGVTTELSEKTYVKENDVFVERT